MTVLMIFGFAVSYVGVMLTLWGAVELAIADERNRVEWMKKSGIRRNRASGR